MEDKSLNQVHLSRFIHWWMSRNFSINKDRLQPKTEISIFHFSIFTCVSAVVVYPFFLWCFDFIYSTFHVIFNRKREINHVLKLLKNVCKVA